jgi:hypothetical protein
VLPISKERQLGPRAAQFLLTQQTRVLVTGNLRLTTGSGMAIASSLLALWQEGFYTPGPAYPYTLEEMLLDLQEGLKPKRNYDVCFQSFTPANREKPRGIGEVAMEIVQHPEMKLWQIWMMMDGSCTFLVASRDPAKAQGNLESIISASRKGGTDAKSAALYRQVQSQADGEPKQLLYERMLSLI